MAEPTPSQSLDSSMTTAATTTTQGTTSTATQQQAPNSSNTNGAGTASTAAAGATDSMVDEAHPLDSLPVPPLTKKDKSLQTFLSQMDEYAPIIPDAVTDYYLSLSGLHTNDIRLKRLLALATQKFISELAADAFQYSKVRQGGGQGQVGGQVGQGGQIGAAGGIGMGGEGKKGGRTVLTIEDLGCAVAEYGVDVRRGEFYR